MKNREHKKIAIFLLLAVLLQSCTDTTGEKATDSAFPPGEIIDLSHDFSEDTIYWVTAKRFEKETVAEGMTENGFYYSAYNISGAEHGGTHIDAPIHFAKDRNTVDQIPLSSLIAKAVKIELSDKALGNSDYQVSVKDLEDWEKVHGNIPDGSILLLETGFGRFYPDAEKYLGTAKRGDDAQKDLHFPGLAPSAAKWIVKERKVAAVGIDTPSIDYGQSSLFESHVTLMTENIPAFENVANLDRLPETGFFVVALPMKIKGGSGGPLRIIGIVPEQQ